LPERATPELLDAALRVQLELQRVWEQCGEPVGGWKVGFTSVDPRVPGDKRRMFAPEYRPFGFVLASRILGTGASVPRRSIQVCNLEPELCLVLDRPLRGDDVDADSARRAVRAVAPAFEINEVQRVSSETPLPVRVATGLNNWGMVVGEGIEPPDWDLRSTSVEVRPSDSEPTVVPAPGDALDDPYRSLARLCRRLHRFDRGLEAGAHVITGSFSHHRVAENQTWTAAFSGIGDVTVTFTA
jgi:2-keto-4-pentenoate hydratase